MTYYEQNREKCLARVKKYYQEHRNKKLEYQRKWKKQNKDKCKKYSDKYRKNHKEYFAQWQRKFREKNPEYYCNPHQLRTKCIEKLGGKCSNPNCAVLGRMKDSRCLQIDHVHGGGKKEVRKLGLLKFYQKVLIDTEGNYQLLCANCNWIKRCENEETS